MVREFVELAFAEVTSFDGLALTCVSGSDDASSESGAATLFFPDEHVAGQNHDNLVWQRCG